MSTLAARSSRESTDFDQDGFEEDSSLVWSLFEYHSDENIESGETDELRIIPLAYASLIDSECQTTELEVAQFDPDWAEDNNDGSISEEESIELIVDGYEINEIP